MSDVLSLSLRLSLSLFSLSLSFFSPPLSFFSLFLLSLSVSRVTIRLTPPGIAMDPLRRQFYGRRSFCNVFHNMLEERGGGGKGGTGGEGKKNKLLLLALNSGVEAVHVLLCFMVLI